VAAWVIPFGLFLGQAVVISLSGVMAPGPLTAVAVGKGVESPRSGAWVAVGHGVVEFPLMVSIWLGLWFLESLRGLEAVIGALGGGVLLLMGLGMLRSIRQVKAGGDDRGSSALVAGIVLTAANPYFLVWWFTIGSALILRSVRFGLLGFAAFAIAHWLCDLGWCCFLSALSFRGGRFFGSRFQGAVFAVTGAFLVVLSIMFFADAIRSL